MSIRSRLSRLVLVLLAVPFLTGPLAGTDVWVPMGPDGGSVSALAWAPDGWTVYAGTAWGGVFRSLDGGRSWMAAGKGLRGAVNRIAIDTRQPSTVYTATSEGLFRSLDGGTAWRDVAPREAAAGGLLSALAVAVSSRGTLYASFDGHSRGGLFRSTDRGVTWQPAGPDLPGPTLALAADPRMHQIFAATWSGLFRSRDGVTWSPAGLELQVVTEVLIDPHQPGRVLAVSLQPHHGLAMPVVHVSENGGRWRRSFLGAEGTAFGKASLVADPATPGTFYAAAAETIDGTGFPALMISNRLYKSLFYFPPEKNQTRTLRNISLMPIASRPRGMRLRISSH